MKKQTWEEPQILVQKFMPNEYIAACGDSGIVYNFECNAGDPNKRYDVYTDDGRLLTKDRYSWLGTTTRYFQPCGTTHEADSDGVFMKGYMVDNKGVDGRDGARTDVYIWTGENNDDVHCTTNLDMNSWTTAKS